MQLSSFDMRVFQAILIFLFGAINTAGAQQLADVSVSARMEGGGSYIAPNSFRKLTVSFTNNGPSTALGAAFTDFFLDPARRRVLIGRLPETRCDLFDDGGFGSLVALGFIFQPGSMPVPAGTTLSCTVGISVFPEAPPRFFQSFFVNQGNDPDVSNNRFDLEITTNEVVATQIPTLGFGMKLTLACLSLLLGLWWARRAS